MLDSECIQLGLTPEIRAALEAPLDPRAIKKVDKGARGKFDYAEVDYLEQRLTQVDPNWEKRITAVASANAIMTICELTVCGVPRAATSPYATPVEVTYWDNKEKVRKTRPATSDDLNTDNGGAEAAAFRRACATYGLGAQLWRKEQARWEVADLAMQTAPSKELEVVVAQPARVTPQASKHQDADPEVVTSTVEGISDAQYKALTGMLHVPAEEVATWDRRKYDDGTARGFTVPGYMIQTLQTFRNGNRAAYEKSPEVYIAQALGAAMTKVAALVDDNDPDE